MGVFSIHNPLVLVFGILGNLVSFSVYLAPAPTFFRIVKKKSTEGFHSVPYVAALLSSMLWIYYALVKSNEVLLISINSIGCVVESFYIIIYIFYAEKNSRIIALKLFLLLNIVGFGLVLIFVHFFIKGRSARVEVLGWISVALTATVYIAPLSIIKQVIRTKSVEFMPISLTLTLSLNALIWLFYGLLLKDFFVAAPNIPGLIFGAVQIILYASYKNNKSATNDDDRRGDKLPKTKTMTTCEVFPVCVLTVEGDDDHVSKETTEKAMEEVSPQLNHV